MKKIIALVCLLLIIGLGCAQKQEPNNQQNATQEKSIPTNLSTSEIKNLETIHAEKSKDFNYNFFSPTYIPNKLILNSDSFNTEENNELGKTITYLFGANMEPTNDWIFVRQQIDKRTDAEKILNSRMTPIDELNGYSIISNTPAGTYNNIVFSQNNILVSIMSNNISLEELIIMAKSMAKI